MNSNDKIKVGAGLAIIAGILLAIGGYVANIVKLFGLIAGPFSAELAIRAVGVFAAPLGAIAGYL